MTNSRSAWHVNGRVASRFLVAGLVILLGMLIGIAMAVLVPDRYTASVTCLVTLPTASSSDTETVLRTAQALVTSRVVLHDLASASDRSLTASDVSDRLQVRRAPGSGVIEVLVVETSASRASALARQLAPTLSRRIGQLPESASRTNDVSLSPYAGQPLVQRRPSGELRYGVLGAFMGLLAALALDAFTRRGGRRSSRTGIDAYQTR